MRNDSSQKTDFTPSNASAKPEMDGAFFVVYVDVFRGAGQDRTIYLYAQRDPLVVY